MKIGNEQTEVNRLITVWQNKVDLDAKEFTHLEAALARAKMMIVGNKSWTNLKSVYEDISVVLNQQHTI